MSKLITHVVIKNGNRGFLVKEEYLSDPDILSLVDARLIHVLQTGRIEEETRFALLILDFGTYVQEFRTGREIHFFVPSKEERAKTVERTIFSEITNYSNDTILYYTSKMKFRACYYVPVQS